MLGDVQAFLDQHQHFLLTTHQQPDGDGLGSCVAFQDLLESTGKTSSILLCDPEPEALRFLDIRAEVFDRAKASPPATALIVLDTHRPERLGPLAECIHREAWDVLCLDHHPKACDFGTVQLLDPSACATGILVYELYQHLDVELSFRAARALYTSLYSDTGRFAHGCEDGRAHLVAAACVQAGVRPGEIHQQMIQALTQEQACFLARVVAMTEAYCQGQLLVQTVSAADLQKLGTQQFDPTPLHAFNRGIEGAQCAVVLVESAPNEVRISVRSRPGLDIGRVMGYLGGGGHAQAAG
ncbi:MAG: DHH family phosphoesterase, partial [Chlamydiia bacterium]|nr:DHH family phosphoesterase [Chlamydiia bacterium]